MPVPSIFISYRRDDSAGHAGRLFDHLVERFGTEHVFMDVAGIAPGRDFVEAIETAVGGCDVLLAVIGKQWFTLTDAEGRRRIDDPSDFVRLEIATALRRNVRVIPVLVQSAVLQSAQPLPADLQALTRRQAVELSDNRWDSDAARVIAAIEKIVGLDSSAVTPNAIPKPLPAVQKSKLLYVLAGLLLFAGAISLGINKWRADQISLTAPQPADVAVTVAASSSPVKPANAPAAPTPRLALPIDAEITLVDNQYKILSAEVESGDDGKRLVHFLVRCTSHHYGGANFGSDSFRLLIDGVPREPLNSFNLLVAQDSAQEGEISFAVAKNTTRAELEIGNGTESTKIPVDFSLAKPAGPAPPPAPRHSGPFPLDLPAGMDIKQEAQIVRILAARVERYNMEKLALTFSVRLTNNDRYDVGLWSDSYRLLVDGVPRAPVNFLNELVDSRSAKEGEVKFVFPDTTQSLVLQIGAVNRTGGKKSPAKLPISWP